jgi:hypothetical protein
VKQRQAQERRETAERKAMLEEVAKRQVMYQVRETPPTFAWGRRGGRAYGPQIVQMAATVRIVLRGL